MTRTPILAAALIVSLANQAHAHAFLRSAEPRVGSTVTTAPKEVAIEFTETVEPAFSAIAVTDQSGTRVDIGAAHLEGDARLAITLKPLAAGIYHVTWHATATDTHKTQGSFTFTVAG